MNDWELTILSEICDFTVGHVSSMAHAYVASGITFLRSQNIHPYILKLDDVKFINEEFHRKLKKSELRPGDVVVVRTGYPGTACVIPESLETSNCADLVIIRPSSKVNPHYLSAVFNSTWGKSLVAGRLVGAAQQHFNVGAAKSMELRIPPRGTQDQIAKTLCDFNDLIETNDRAIVQLEEMARLLYRAWFVDFKFPGHERVELVDSGHPDFGTIPEGWSVSELSSIAFLNYGKALKAEDRTHGPFPVYGSSGIVGRHDSFLVEGPGIIVGRKGNVGATYYSPTNFYPIDTVYYVSREQSTPFAFQTLKSFKFLSGDAAVPGLNREYAHSRKVLTPSNELVSQYNILASVFRLLLDNTISQNICLMEMRDLLLPKLLSGEIDLTELPNAPSGVNGTNSSASQPRDYERVRQ